MVDDTPVVGLVVDGEDFSGEYESAAVATPRLVYEEDNGVGVMRFLGPMGFQITLVGPSDRVRALVDDGSSVRDVTVTVRGMSVSVPVQFLREWDSAGTTKVFGRLALDHSSEPKWEPAT